MTEREALRERLNPVPAGRCLLGLSGGADSVALAWLLLPLRDGGKLRPEAVHVNHGLRGAESDADEEFVRRFCEDNEIPLHRVRLDLDGRRDENTAREARYAAMFRVMEENEIPTLVLAHQRDDQAETFLMRLMRGAGPEGLSAMRAEETRQGKTLLRPMLDISGGELREALRSAGIPWREDGSNREKVYLRNRVRMELIPLMEEMAPGAGGRIARTAGLIGQENDAMAARAETLTDVCDSPEGLETEPLRAEPEAVRRRVFRAWWRKHGPKLDERELSYDQTRRLSEMIDAPRGTIINLPAGWRARREKNAVRLLEPGNRTRNNRPGKRKETT